MKRREVLQAGMALGGLAGLGRALAQGGFTLTLVHTNDTHAHLEPVELTLSGEKTPVGGVARRVALFDRVLLTVHSDDMSVRDSYAARLLEAGAQGGRSAGAIPTPAALAASLVAPGRSLRRLLLRTRAFASVRLLRPPWPPCR